MAQEVPVESPPEENANPEETSEDKVTEDVKKSETSSTAPVRDKIKERRDRNRPPTKIVVRRLPPTMTEAVFIEQVSPLPEHDYLSFVRADLSLGPGAFSRAYINFIHQSDILTFKDQFDGYVFVDMYGNEFAAVVEFAPFQRVPKKSPNRRKDTLAGTIEEDPAYISFLQTLEEEMKDKENEHTFDYSYQLPEKDDKKVTTTPLLEFLKQRRAERQRSRDERKEERRKKERERELERRKQRDEERRKKRPDKDTVAAKQVLVNPAKDQDSAAKPARFKETKPVSERKRDEDKPSSYKDKKYLENRGNTREKPAFKPNVGIRQKTDARPAREDKRSMVEQRKKTSTKSEMDRKVAPTKPARYSEREPRPKVDRKKSDKEDVSAASEEVKPSPPEMLDEKSQIKESLSEDASKKRVSSGTRRSSFEMDRPPLDHGKTAALRKSAECLLDKEPPCLKGSLLKPKKSAEKARRSSLESEVAKSRGPMRRNLSLELESEASKGEEEAGEKKRPERRIRNKDRPSIEIYRPGMGRISKQRIEREKD